jgi:hypothetical protein
MDLVEKSASVFMIRFASDDVIVRLEDMGDRCAGGGGGGEAEGARTERRPRWKL